MSTTMQTLAEWLAQHGLEEIEGSLKADHMKDPSWFTDLDLENLEEELAETSKVIKGARWKRLTRAIKTFVSEDSALKVSRAVAERPGTARASERDFQVVPAASMQGPMLTGLKQANMKEATEVQRQMMLNFVRFRGEHQIVSACRHLVASFVAEAAGGTDLGYLCLSNEKTEKNVVLDATDADAGNAVDTCVGEDGSSGAEVQDHAPAMDAKEKAHDCIQKLSDTVDGMDKQIHDRRDEFARIAHLHQQLDKEATAWQDSLLLYLQMPPTKDAPKIKQSTFTEIYQESSSLLKIIDETRTSKELAPPDPEMIKQCDNMFKAIRYNKTRDLEEKAAFMKQMVKLTALRDDYVVLAKAAASDSAHAARLKELLKDLEKQFGDKRERLEQQHRQARLARERAGNGQWHLKGNPNDERSKRLKAMFDDARYSELTVYESKSKNSWTGNISTFSCWKDENLTSAQMDAQRNLEMAEKSLKEYTDSYHHERAQATDEEEFAKYQQQADFKNKELAKLQKQIDDMENTIHTDMKDMPPAQVANSQLLQKVSSLMRQAVQNFCPCDDDLRSLRHIVQKINDLSQDPSNEPENLMKFVGNLLTQLADDRTRLSLLSKLGVSGLREFLTPAVDPTCFLQLHSEEEEEVGRASAPMQARLEDLSTATPTPRLEDTSAASSSPTNAAAKVDDV